MWKTEHTETTSASPDEVWRIVSDFETWGRWNPGYREAHLDGDLTPGTPGRVVLANGLRRPFALVEATPAAAAPSPSSPP